MKREMIQKLMTNRYMNQHKLKVQPVKKFMINTKEIKMSFLKKMHEICVGDKRNDNIGGYYVSSLEEAEMRSSADSVNGDDDLVSGFDATTCSVNNIYEIFDNKDGIITIWEGKAIKIPYSDLSQDSNYLKMIRINTKKTGFD